MSYMKNENFCPRQGVVLLRSGRSCASCARDIRTSLYSTAYTTVCEHRRKRYNTVLGKRAKFFI